LARRPTKVVAIALANYRFHYVRRLDLRTCAGRLGPNHTSAAESGSRLQHTEAGGGKEMEVEKIELKFVESKFLFRRSCTICGGHTEKDYVLVEAETPWGTVRACWLCLKGDNADKRGFTIDERLARHAERVEEYARFVRSLVGRLRAPTYQAWQAEEKRVELRLRRDIDEAIWGKSVASFDEEEPHGFAGNAPRRQVDW
jgi:hypothetical protein